MSKYCDNCFRDTEKEDHQSWCPNKLQGLEAMFEGVFEEIFKETKNENEKDTTD